MPLCCGFMVLDKGNGVRRDSFFPTYKSHTLGSSGFYRNIVNFGMENVGQGLLHERYVRIQLRTFGTDGGIDVAE